MALRPPIMSSTPPDSPRPVRVDLNDPSLTPQVYPEMPPRTDAGNAELIAALYGDRLRYVVARKQWLVLDDGCWKKRSMEEVRVTFAAAAARHRAKVCDPDVWLHEYEWGIKSESLSRLNAALHLAKGLAPICDSRQSLSW